MANYLNFTSITLNADRKELIIRHDGGSTTSQIDLSNWTSIRVEPDGSGGNDVHTVPNVSGSGHRLQIRVEKNKAQNIQWGNIYAKLIGDNDMRDLLGGSASSNEIDFLWNRQPAVDQLIMKITTNYIYFSYR